MYGAVLRPHTELTETGKAEMGVLFLTNDGYSTMCGHATLALGRFLVDSVCDDWSDPMWAGSTFSTEHGHQSNQITFYRERGEALLRLHAPCGVVRVTVPFVAYEDGSARADTKRPVSYLSVPSYATGVSVVIEVAASGSWPELGQRREVVVDIAYGGAFYIVVSASQLGFPPAQLNSLTKPTLAALNEATKTLKRIFNSNAELRAQYLQHAEHADLQFLYGVIVTAPSAIDSGEAASENSICFFANEQVDRSPTGSGVQARVALAYAKGELKLGESRTYHSPV